MGTAATGWCQPGPGYVRAVEVPWLEDENINWRQLSIDFPAASESTAGRQQRLLFPRTSAGGGRGASLPTQPNLQRSLFWRIHESSPSSLELIEGSLSTSLQRNGLRIQFPAPLFAKILIEASAVTGSDVVYSVLAFTEAGIVYILRLPAPATTTTSSLKEVKARDFTYRNKFSELSRVTDPVDIAVAGQHHLCIGGSNGSVLVIPLPQLSTMAAVADPPAYELKESGSLWRGFLQRSRRVRGVSAMSVQLMDNKRYLVVAHEEGVLRAWDVQGHLLTSQDLPTKSDDSQHVPSLLRSFIFEDGASGLLVVLKASSKETHGGLIVLYSIAAVERDGDERQAVQFEQRSVISYAEAQIRDAIVAKGVVWALAMVGDGRQQCASVLFMDLESLRTLQPAEVISWPQWSLRCQLQQEAVAAALVQSANSADEHFIQTHIGSSLEEFLLAMLLQPGILSRTAIRLALRAHDRHISPEDAMGLSLHGLAKEVATVIHAKAGRQRNRRQLQAWWEFMCDYTHCWRQAYLPLGFHRDNLSGAVGLVTTGSITTFRSCDRAESLSFGDWSAEELAKAAPARQVLEDAVTSQAGQAVTVAFAPLRKLLECCASVRLQLPAVARAALPWLLGRVDVNSLERIAAGYTDLLQKGPFPEHEDRSLDDEQIGIRRKLRRRHLVWTLEFEQHLQDLQGVVQHAHDPRWQSTLQVVDWYLGFLETAGQAAPEVYDMDTSEHVAYGGNDLMRAVVQSIRQHTEALGALAFDVYLLLSYLQRLGSQAGLDSMDMSFLHKQLLARAQALVVSTQIGHWLSHHYALPPGFSAADDFSSHLSSLRISKEQGETGQQTGYTPLLHMVLAPQLTGTLRSGPASPAGLSAAALVHASRIWCEPRRMQQAVQIGHFLYWQGQFELLPGWLWLAHQTPGNLLDVADSHTSGLDFLQGLCGLAALARLSRDGSESLGVQRTQLERAKGCFFRAASGIAAKNEDMLQILSVFLREVSRADLAEDAALQRLQYLDLVMLLFERSGSNAGARDMAYAALQQVDAAYAQAGADAATDAEGTSASTGVRDEACARLWENILQYSLEDGQYHAAYQAVVSHPLPARQKECLRRLLAALCEKNAVQTLCELPFAGFLRDVDDILGWRAEHGELGARPNYYKLLHALHTSRSNHRRAALYMYQYAQRLSMEGGWQCHAQQLQSLQVAINSLNLVDPKHAWLELPNGDQSNPSAPSPSKRQRGSSAEQRTSGSGRYLDLSLSRERAVATASASTALPSEALDDGHALPIITLNEIEREAGLLQAQDSRLLCCLWKRTRCWHRFWNTTRLMPRSRWHLLPGRALKSLQGLRLS
eukprot:jgi/Chlat1/227/Chrsp1S03133